VPVTGIPNCRYSVRRIIGDRSLIAIGMLQNVHIYRKGLLTYEVREIFKAQARRHAFPPQRGLGHGQAAAAEPPANRDATQARARPLAGRSIRRKWFEHAMRMKSSARKSRGGLPPEGIVAKARRRRLRPRAIFGTESWHPRPSSRGKTFAPVAFKEAPQVHC